MSRKRCLACGGKPTMGMCPHCGSDSMGRKNPDRPKYPTQTPETVAVAVAVEVVVSILPHVRMQIDRHQFGERQWRESTDGRNIELVEKHRQLANLWGLLAIALEEALQAQRQTEGGEKA